MTLPTLAQAPRGIWPAVNVSRWPRLDPLSALPPLTLLHLLLHAPEAWYLRAPLIGLFLLGAVFRRWLRTPPFWYLTATLLGTSVYLHWESADNHKYLFVYWCLALCCAFSLPKQQQRASLAISSRWLIGLCMALATVWKLCQLQYLDGTFFQYCFLEDERFAHFTARFADLPLQNLADNRQLRDLLTSGHLQGLDMTRVTLTGAAQLASLSWFFTWWTVFIEGALALGFLLPNSRWTALIRNGLLILFGMTTYGLAPVRGFGWMLMLLGLAQCQAREIEFRYGYLFALLLIQAYTLPLAEIVTALAK